MKRTKILFAAIAVLLLLAGCGRKEMPQPVVDAPPPVITAITHELVGKSLKIEMQISGGSHGVGYQIDRAEIDPFCNCPGFWRRFVEATPREENLGKQSLSELITLKTPKTEYAFRVRAIDLFGRFSEWSAIIRVKAEVSAFR